MHNFSLYWQGQKLSNVVHYIPTQNCIVLTIIYNKLFGFNLVFINTAGFNLVFINTAILEKYFKRNITA